MPGFDNPLALLAHWDLEPIHSINVLLPQESVVGEIVAFVETTSGIQYVLKRETLWRTPPQENLLLEALAAQGLPVSVPIRARSGDTYVQVGEEFIDQKLFYTRK